MRQQHESGGYVGEERTAQGSRVGQARPEGYQVARVEKTESRCTKDSRHTTVPHTDKRQIRRFHILDLQSRGTRPRVHSTVTGEGALFGVGRDRYGYLRLFAKSAILGGRCGQHVICPGHLFLCDVNAALKVAKFKVCDTGNCDIQWTAPSMAG